MKGKMVNSDGDVSSGIGSILGWLMAAIYMGGRLPQIFLNVKMLFYYLNYLLRILQKSPYIIVNCKQRQFVIDNSKLVSTVQNLGTNSRD